MKGWLFLTVALCLNASANLLLKLGARSEPALDASAGLVTRATHFLNLATVAGIALFAANVLFYRKALEALPVSAAYPVMVSGGLVIIVIAARFLPALNERINLWQVLGMVLIVAGVWLVASQVQPQN
jgi:multidrug transporter EmrE-like cation transporter